MRTILENHRTKQLCSTHYAVFSATDFVYTQSYIDSVQDWLSTCWWCICSLLHLTTGTPHRRSHKKPVVRQSHCEVASIHSCLKASGFHTRRAAYQASSSCGGIAPYDELMRLSLLCESVLLLDIWLTKLRAMKLLLNVMSMSLRRERMTSSLPIRRSTRSMASTVDIHRCCCTRHSCVRATYTQLNAWDSQTLHVDPQLKVTWRNRLLFIYHDTSIGSNPQNA